MHIVPVKTSDSIVRVIFDTPLGQTKVDQIAFDPIDFELPEGVIEDDVTVIQVGVKPNGEITDEAICLKAATPRPEPEETTDGVLETDTEGSEEAETTEEREEVEVTEPVTEDAPTPTWTPTRNANGETSPLI